MPVQPLIEISNEYYPYPRPVSTYGLLLRTGYDLRICFAPDNLSRVCSRAPIVFFFSGGGDGRSKIQKTPLKRSYVQEGHTYYYFPDINFASLLSMNRVSVFL